MQAAVILDFILQCNAMYLVIILDLNFKVQDFGKFELLYVILSPMSF